MNWLCPIAPAQDPIILSLLIYALSIINKELKNLFDRIITERHEGLLGFNRVFIGQPVQYGDKSFIRLAIGSYSVRKQMEKKKFDPKNDIRLIEIIEEYVGKIHSV